RRWWSAPPVPATVPSPARQGAVSRYLSRLDWPAIPPQGVRRGLPSPETSEKPARAAAHSRTRPCLARIAELLPWPVPSAPSPSPPRCSSDLRRWWPVPPVPATVPSPAQQGAVSRYLSRLDWPAIPPQGVRRGLPSPETSEKPARAAAHSRT